MTLDEISVELHAIRGHLASLGVAVSAVDRVLDGCDSDPTGAYCDERVRKLTTALRLAREAADEDLRTRLGRDAALINGVSMNTTTPPSIREASERLDKAVLEYMTAHGIEDYSQGWKRFWQARREYLTEKAAYART